MKFQFQGKRVI